MKRIERLKQEVKTTAKAHGHRLSRFMTQYANDEVASATCLRCGAGVSVCSAPPETIYVVKSDETIKVDCDAQLCDRCGHTVEDHDSDGGVHECWNGSGNGNKCPCDQFQPKY